MRNRTVMFVFLVCIAIFIVSTPLVDRSLAEPGGEKAAFKVAVVDVRRLFADCKKNARYRGQINAEQDKAFARLEKLSAEVEAEKAGLRALKEGSGDYMAAMQQVLTKQANLQVARQLHQQRMELKEKQFTEQLYQDILQAVQDAAKQKGYDLVFDKGVVEFPAASANELMMTISTHKLLYSGGCADITDDVLARLDRVDE